MSKLTETIVLLVSSVLGIAFATVYMTLVWTQVRVALKSRFSLQLPQLWGQFSGAGLLATRFALMMMLGILALATTSRSIIEVPSATLILIAGNVLLLLDVMVMTAALQWTVHEDDEENATVAEEIATGEMRAPTLAQMAVSKENPLPVEIVRGPDPAPAGEEGQGR